MLELDDGSAHKVTVLVDVRAQDGLPNPPAVQLFPYLRKVAPLMNDFFPGQIVVPSLQRQSSGFHAERLMHTFIQGDWLAC